MHIYREHFHSSHQHARLLFKQSIQIVEIEVSSYCNRVCSFCPNSYLDRRTHRNYIDDQLFLSILGQLREIDYAGSFRIHRYNEPLSNRTYALGRIRQIKEHLPKSFVYIHTNGDYLNRSYVDELQTAGVGGMRASAYSPKEIFDPLEMEALLRDRVDRLGFPYAMGAWDNIIYADVNTGGDMAFTYAATDFLRERNGTVAASSRGGALGINGSYERVSPCVTPFREFHVEWDGTVMPCCHLRSDVQAHRGAQMTKLTSDSNIFEEWSKGAFVDWRRQMIRAGRKAGPCLTCNFNEIPEKQEVQSFFDAAAAYADNL